MKLKRLFCNTGLIMAIVLGIASPAEAMAADIEGINPTAVEYQNEESVSTNEPDEPALTEEAVSYGSITNYNFNISDVRSSEYNKNLNGADGKYAMIIFGGIGSCGNTNAALSYVSKLSGYMDMNQINIYAFDLVGNSNENIKATLNTLGPYNTPMQGEVCVSSVNADSSYHAFFSKCCQMVGLSGSMSMPIIFYKDRSGNIYHYSTGSVGSGEIAGALQQGGLSVNYSTNKTTVTLTGTTSYTMAYQVLDLVNEERAKVGAVPLTMDADLLEAAMQRAAECSVQFDHNRPNGQSCFSISSKMQGENIAAGYQSAAAAMTGWMNSQGHRENLLNSDYRSVGIGCVCVDGRWYWTQCFGVECSPVSSVPKDLAKQFLILCDAALTPQFEKSAGELYVGDTHQLRIKIGNATLDANTFIWKSSNSTVASVDSKGKITAKKAGSVTITAANSFATSQQAGYTLTVKNKDTGNTGGSGNTGDAGDSGNSGDAGNTGGSSSGADTKQIEAFVKRMYEVALVREAEAAGLKDWSNRLATGQIDGAGIAGGFIGSAELKNQNLNDLEYVVLLYMTFFDRFPDEAGLNYWYSYLYYGGNREQVLCGFVNSQEFSNLCDAYGIARGTMQADGSSIYRPGVRSFVLRMYTKALKRDGETLGVEDWTNRINTGVMSPEAVAKSFFGSEEFVNKNLNNADYVETLYQTFMDRASDKDGKAYWVAKLGAGASRESVLEGFSRSQEFTMIMKRYGL